MKIVHIERLVDFGVFSRSAEWKTIRSHVVESIKSIEWPPGSGRFILHDEPGKKRGKGSGVKQIKDAFLEHLVSLGWNLETPLNVGQTKKPGKVDATFPVWGRLFCVEWETGNISSTHRALNKMLLGMQLRVLIGGVLILPTRTMYRYLTDRVGNYEEIEPYFPLFRSYPVEEGLLVVVAIEQDAVSKSVPRLRKGTNGRALA